MVLPGVEFCVIIADDPLGDGGCGPWKMTIEVTNYKQSSTFCTLGLVSVNHSNKKVDDKSIVYMSR